MVSVEVILKEEKQKEKAGVCQTTQELNRKSVATGRMKDKSIF